MSTPADVYGALIAYARDGLTGVACYLGRVPESTTVTNRRLPHVVLDGSLDIEWQTEGGWVASGGLAWHCYAEGDTAACELGALIEELFGDPEDWTSIVSENDTGLKFFEAAQSRCSLTMEDQKSPSGQPVYRYEIPMSVKASGAF